MLPEKPTLLEIQKHLADECAAKGWDKNSITEVFLLLTEEVGELAKAVRKETAFKGEKKPESKDHLVEEIADVFNYLLEIANRFDVDLESAYRQKHSINQTRTWN